MHISLDSALGRQRRLNSVGESVLQIAPNAAAAYSLRSLTGGDPQVVRVRRASDNGERDFTSSEITSGEMVSWVNQQVIAPLDIQALEADGRTGDFLIAKAAYSLRSLGTRQATIPNDAAPLNEDTVVPASGKYVVQVRRNVNGDLKSFTATEVTDGTLESFVNESFTSSLPLDVAGSAEAAYGLRNLSSSYSGNVVEVRRSSDGFVKPFTAGEITDGTLLAFGNESVTASYNAEDGDSPTDSGLSKLDTDGSSTTLSNVISSELGGTRSFKIDITSGTNTNAGYPRVRQSTTGDLALSAGLQYRFKCKLKLTSGAAHVKAIIGTSGTQTVFIGRTLEVGQLVEIDETFTPTSAIDSDNITFSFNGTYGAGTILLDDIELTALKHDVHVKTWYDQSGNTNDAVQTTPARQPKIVSAGSLEADGITFYGTSTSPQFLNTTSAISSTNVAIAVVSKSDVNGTGAIFSMLDGFNDGHEVLYLQNSVRYALEEGGGPGNDLDVSSTPTNKNLYFANYDGSTQGLSINGTNNTQSVSTTVDTITSVSQIGSRQGANLLNGSIEELIVYTSDQSDKRRAIEESIATANGITLPSFNRDGFVKTWYDQSVTNEAGDTATGNHAVQATAASQPQIVNAGALVSDAGNAAMQFDATNDFLTADSLASNFSGTDKASSAFIKYGGMADTGTFNQFYSFSNSSAIGGIDAGDLLLCLFRSNAPSGGRYLGYLIDDDSSAMVEVTSTSSLGANKLVTLVGDRSSDSVFSNGSATTISDLDSTSGALTFDQFSIGVARRGAGLSNYFSGKMSEFIIYNDDQTANRTAIEANIGEAYSITGIPAYDDEVDGFVETWYDQSGNSNDVTQATAGSQPKIVNAGSLVTVGGRASFKFNGSSDFLDRETYTQGSLSQPNTLFSVAELDAYADENRKVYDGHESTARNMLQLNTAGNGQFAHYAGTVAATGEDADADRHLFTSLINGASSDLRIDGTSKTTANTGSQGMTGIVIGANNVPTSNFWDGDIQEIIIYNSNQSSTTTAVETNINSHYSIF